MKNKTISAKEKASNKIKKTILSLLAITAIGQGVFSYVKDSHSALNLLNSNDEVKQNCEILGVDYSNLEMASIGAIKYYLTGKEDNKSYLNIPINRCVPEIGNVVKVFIDKNFSKQYQKLIIECVNEINYIAKNIGDPICYEVEIGNGKERRECDITVVKRTEAKIAPNEKSISGEAKGLSYKFINGVLTCLYPTMELSYEENDKNENKFQHTVMHEFAHLIYGARDVFMKKDKELSISNFEEAKSFRYFTTEDFFIKKKVYDANIEGSIINDSPFYSIGDILLWSAKNTKNLKENEEKVRNFAKKYQAECIEYELKKDYNQVSKYQTNLENLQMVRERFEENISNFLTLSEEDLFILEFYNFLNGQFKKLNLEEKINEKISSKFYGETFNEAKLENFERNNFPLKNSNSNFVYIKANNKTAISFVMPDGTFATLENYSKDSNKIDVSKCYLFKQYENSVVKIGIDLKNKNKVESIEISSKPSQEQELNF